MNAPSKLPAGGAPAVREAQEVGDMVSEVDFRSVIEGALEGTLLFDRQGVVRYANPAIRRDLGYPESPGFPPGTTWRQLLAPEAAPTVEAWLSTFFAAPARERFSGAFALEARRADDSRFLAQVDLSGQWDDDTPLFVLSLRDLSDTVRVDAALRELRHDFRTFIDRLPEAILVVRRDRIVHASPALERLLGVKPGSLVARGADSFVIPEERAAFRAELFELERVGGAVEPMHSRWLRADGEVLTVTRSLSVVDFEGERAVVVVARHNVLTRTLAERSEQLERMMALTTLAAGVGHEINNPMAYVTANLAQLGAEVEALRKVLPGLGTATPADRDAALTKAAERLGTMGELLADAQQGAARVREIVLSLRVFARATEEPREFVDVQEVLETALSLSWERLRRAATVARDYHELPPVKASEARLLQVFGCVLSNAVHALEAVSDRPRQLSVRTSVEGEEVVVIFEDTGVGMRPEELARAFDPFFTTRPVGAGMGLGLFIVQSTVTGWGGRVTATSSPGRGTTLRLALPAAPVALRTPPPRFEAPRRRVLLVDDEPSVTRALRRSLMGHHEVVEASGAREALALLEAGQSFDAVVCDVVMPEMTGVDFVAALRAAAPALAQRVVLMTGGVASGPLSAALKALGAPTLEKPFETQTLLAALDRCFAQPRQG